MKECHQLVERGQGRTAPMLLGENPGTIGLPSTGARKKTRVLVMGRGLISQNLRRDKKANGGRP
jgi:hypothetical protein